MTVTLIVVLTLIVVVIAVDLIGRELESSKCFGNESFWLGFNCPYGVVVAFVVVFDWFVVFVAIAFVVFVVFVAIVVVVAVDVLIGLLLRFYSLGNGEEYNFCHEKRLKLHVHTKAYETTATLCQATPTPP